MTNKEKKYSEHHKVCRSVGGNNDEDNLVVMTEVKHRAIHTLFGNNTFIEKVNELINMDITVLQGDFVRDIQKVLDLYDGLEYHKHVVKQKQGNE